MNLKGFVDRKLEKERIEKELKETYENTVNYTEFCFSDLGKIPIHEIDLEKWSDKIIVNFYDQGKVNLQVELEKEPFLSKLEGPEVYRKWKITVNDYHSFLDLAEKEMIKRESLKYQLQKVKNWNSDSLEESMENYLDALPFYKKHLEEQKSKSSSHKFKR